MRPDTLPLGQFVLGAALLSLAVGSSAAFSALVVGRRLPELRGAPRLLAFWLLATLGFIGIHLVPGALGVLGKGSVAACALLLLAAGATVRRREPAARPRLRRPGAASDRVSKVIAGMAASASALYAVAYAVDHGAVATRGVDMTTFHLPNIARWIQTGSLWGIHDFVPHRSFGTYPNSSDVVTLGTILPFDSDFLVRFVNYPALAALALAVYALARELTAPASTAVLFASGFVAMPVVTRFAFDGLADTLMLATFGTGVFFLTRHRRTGATSDLVLAALGLGIAFGTKWYAPPAVAAVVVGWTVVALAEGTPWRAVAGRTAAVGGIVAAAGGFWLLRNLLQTGNPVFPVEVAFGDVTLFPAPRDIHREMFGFTLAGLLDDPAVWQRLLWPTFLELMSWLSVLLWLGLPVAAALAWRRARGPAREARVSRSVLAWAATAAAIGLVYLFLPYTALGREEHEPVLAMANSRYVVPALLLAAGLAAWTCGRIGRFRIALEALVLVALLDALRRSEHVSLAAALVAVAILAALLGGAWLAWRLLGGVASPRRWGLGAVAACGLAVFVVALFLQERRFNDSRYTEADATARWVRAKAPAGRRVGVVGEGFIVYPMFGPRLENEVEYVGPTVDGMLRTYNREPAFRAALGRGRYDLVLLQDAGLVEPRLPRRHEQWLSEMGYRLVASGRQDTSFDQPARLYRPPQD